MDDLGDEFRELDHICVPFATFNRAWASRPKEDVQRAEGTNGEQGQSGKSLSRLLKNPCGEASVSDSMAYFSGQDVGQDAWNGLPE
jgi:hypothetical protein